MCGVGETETRATMRGEKGAGASDELNALYAPLTKAASSSPAASPSRAPTVSSPALWTGPPGPGSRVHRVQACSESGATGMMMDTIVESGALQPGLAALRSSRTSTWYDKLP